MTIAVRGRVQCGMVGWKLFHACVIALTKGCSQDRKECELSSLLILLFLA